MKHHYNKEELTELKKKYDMQVNKEAIEEIKYTIDLGKEIERLHSIIKEVREYIGLTDEDREYLGIYDVNGIEILNILDKVEENRNDK